MKLVATIQQELRHNLRDVRKKKGEGDNIKLLNKKRIQIFFLLSFLIILSSSSLTLCHAVTIVAYFPIAVSGYTIRFDTNVVCTSATLNASHGFVLYNLVSDSSFTNPFQIKSTTAGLTFTDVSLTLVTLRLLTSGVVTVVLNTGLGAPSSVDGVTSYTYVVGTGLLTLTISCDPFFARYVYIRYLSPTTTLYPPMPTGTAGLLWQYVVVGDLVGLVTAVYTMQMGEYFYASLMLLLTVPLYIRTQSLTFCVLLWIICSGLLLAFVPLMVQKIVGLFMVLAVGGVLFMLFSRLRR